VGVGADRIFVATEDVQVAADPSPFRCDARLLERPQPFDPGADLLELVVDRRRAHGCDLLVPRDEERVAAVGASTLPRAAAVLPAQIRARPCAAASAGSPASATKRTSRPRWERCCSDHSSTCRYRASAPPTSPP